MINDDLKAMKDESGMTIAQIAQVSKVPVPTITRVLNGDTQNPTFQTVRDIVVALGGSLDKLAGITSIANAGFISEALIHNYQARIHEKSKWMTIFFLCFVSLVAFLVVVFLYDLTHPEMGYMRY